MTKKELLKKIEEQELAHICSLPDNELRLEIAEWFTDNQGEDIETVDRSDLINDYMEDFMRWQNGKSVEELQELLTN